jgi:hypothetical protein
MFALILTAVAIVDCRVSLDDLSSSHEDRVSREIALELRRVKLEFNCRVWHEIVDASPDAATSLGHGHYREARRVRFQSRVAVLKTPFVGWRESVDRQRRVFKLEVLRLLRMQHPSLPQLYGFCLETGQPLGILVEFVESFEELVRHELPSWSVRLQLAVSAARMLQFWDDFVDAGRKQPRFFWDLRNRNLGVDQSRTQIKIVDVESFTHAIDLNTTACHTDHDCVPDRLRRYHDPILQRLGEMRCGDSVCLGQLNSSTNVFRVCLVVIKPLLTRSEVPFGMNERVTRVLDACMAFDVTQRLTPVALLRALEVLRGNTTVRDNIGRQNAIVTHAVQPPQTLAHIAPWSVRNQRRKQA